MLNVRLLLIATLVMLLVTVFCVLSQPSVTVHLRQDIRKLL
ncbi:hypothetical protein VRB95_10645 [Erwinia aphidicola]|jgi:hypothetical protein|uniref:Uncharacterized protein n=1 Tax=Erwinia aphidicola TaxID=68334 RepID=A0ABU8DEZ7_ERWAP|nr:MULTISPECIES: hypothetical protein [Erwinia]MCP2233423.1 hypothetical protein [Erwinia aphidicola]MDI3440897.1 hypothetical protein [Erwinia sp. V90_4]CAH0142582.1 hypothetical protein SRABI13_00322 [Erwinia aphidicola]